MADTIRTWSDTKGITIAKPKQWLRKSFPERAQSFKSPDHRLAPDEIEVLETAWQAHKAGSLDSAAVPLPEIVDADPDHIDLPDEISLPSPAPIRHGSTAQRLWLHHDFVDWLFAAHGSQRNAAFRALESLIAHGRPNRIRGTHGVNAGWLRTPVGGTSGKQWYLWYAGHGARPIGAQIGEREFLVRAVRHHDETSNAIQAGLPEQWHAWSPRELIAETDPGEANETPLSSAQERAIQSSSPVQFIRGTPGAGKTTALLHSVRRLPRTVLYLTFGTRLAARAREWFDAYGADSGEVRVLQFAEFVGQLADYELPPDPTGQTIAMVLGRTLASRTQHLGPWRTDSGVDHELLYAELHAQIFGRATLNHVRGCHAEAEHRQLRGRDAYVRQRQNDIGEAAAQSAWSAARLLSSSEARALFPGPVAATVAVDRLQAGTLPIGLSEFDWIVVDEIQDLTLVEIEVLVEYARALALARGKRPGLRLAGDEGQTLRPTGFSWSELKTILNALGRPEEVVLDANLRSSREVANLVQRVTDVTYPKLPKLNRPCGQRRADIDPVDGGEILLVRVPVARLPQLMDSLASVRAVIQPGREVAPDLIAAAHVSGVQVLSSETAKGLDFDTVAVIGMGAAVDAIHRLATTGGERPLALERARSLADHVRVAASRAVTRLLLVEIEHEEVGNQAIAAAIDELLNLTDDDGERIEPEEIDLHDLAARMQSDTGDAISRMVDELRVSEELLDKEPTLALQRADAAYAAFVRAGRAAAAGRELRDRVFAQRGLSNLACSTVEPDLSKRDRYLKDAQEAFRRSGQSGVADTIATLRDLSKPTAAEGTRLRRLVDYREATLASSASPLMI